MTQDTKETNLHHLQSYIKVRHSKGKDLIAVFKEKKFPSSFYPVKNIPLILANSQICCV